MASLEEIYKKILENKIKKEIEENIQEKEKFEE